MSPITLLTALSNPAFGIEGVAVRDPDLQGSIALLDLQDYRTAGDPKPRKPRLRRSEKLRKRRTLGRRHRLQRRRLRPERRGRPVIRQRGVTP